MQDRKDDQLVAAAQQDLQGQGTPVEATRRLGVTIEQSSAKNETWPRRMSSLTILLAALTSAQRRKIITSVAV
jgi:hypothetical protein